MLSAARSGHIDSVLTNFDLPALRRNSALPAAGKLADFVLIGRFSVSFTAVGTDIDSALFCDALPIIRTAGLVSRDISTAMLLNAGFGHIDRLEILSPLTKPTGGTVRVKQLSPAVSVSRNTVLADINPFCMRATINPLLNM